MWRLSVQARSFRFFSNVVRLYIHCVLTFTEKLCRIAEAKLLDLGARDEDLSRPSARIRFVVLQKRIYSHKHRLCKPVAKKDTIYNAVIKKFYLKPVEK